MQAIPTPTTAPIHLRIADDIRMSIEAGRLSPGDSLPSIAQLGERWRCSSGSVRAAIALLKSQGLVSTSRGRAPTVRQTPHRTVRSSTRHQVEKDAALTTLDIRKSTGEAETNLGIPIAELRFEATYEIITAVELSEIFDIDPTETILKRTYSHSTTDNTLLSSSTSFLPLRLVEGNPALLDEANEPWPGGTMHQLSTVGVEVMQVKDYVTARAASTVEQQLWKTQDGVPFLCCRRISIDRQGIVVEVSDSVYPADRAELEFITELRAWSNTEREGMN